MKGIERVVNKKEELVTADGMDFSSRLLDLLTASLALPRHPSALTAASFQRSGEMLEEARKFEVE